MWNEPDPDPGGKPPEGTPSPREITDLKEQNEQQQLMIAQLKEMLLKEHSTVSQEKVDEYINMLSKVKTKKPRIKREESGGTERGSGIDSIKKEKLNLLKQQLEENKAKLAERGKSQKGIEEMVSQLKAQLNDSQQLVAPISTFEPINLEYSKNSSPEELYNILLIKERKITELTNKNQKQEVNILDLQENLKEKDSVIDARTKAITLMTGSLSKKGKDTLDALDDTKEQMRTMQENFVKLESEMKARQKALLNDLKTKNLEINELQELNRQLTEEKSENGKYSKDSEKQEESNLETVVKEFQEKLSRSHKEIEQYVERTSQLEKQLTDSNIELERLKNTGVTLAPKESDAEIVRLKKQLEESNKNSIKLKAQSKSKIKDLTKKLEAFKKMTDANALIVQLQNENTKLSEKIAELEEEKGNNQLKMVESTDSSKDSNLLEEYKTMEEELVKNKMELEEKDKIISLLEIDIVSLREEINILTEKMSTFSHLKNMQITSEMNSIQIEEEMDKLKEENSLLQNRIKDLTDEKGDLNERIEHLLKEKEELNTKLDSYIQENMDLIDKLEKLSAEKVSSVESIEIVEGLTQQEKLELAAYQKNMEEPLKCSQDEENLEPPPELNESVMQLTEDSAELLRKIEMFNAERKEVMGKMEELKEENNRLAMKVNEIENNRDILAETYEQLQTEKEELQEKKEELLMKLSRIEDGLDRPEDVVSLKEGTSEALQKLQHDYEKLLAENVELKQSLKKLDSIVQEKYNLEVELNGAKTKIELLDSVLKDNMEEITNYQMIIDENKNELINSSNIINSLQGTLNEKENDIKELNELINDLNRIVSNLQAENEKLGNFELMERQVDELKTALNKQIEQAEDYSEELERSNETIGSLTSQLDQMKNKISETENEIEIKYIELQKFETQLINKDEIIKNLQSQLSEKEHKINSVIEEMKQKYLVLQKNLDGNNDSVQKRVEELTTKNKEQLEKMKKIAANLKKKTQALQDLEEKYKAENEKWETELNEKESVITHKSNQIAELTSALEETEQVKVDLQNMLLEARHKQEKMNEVSLKQELSTSLHEEFDNTVHVDKNSANEDKLKELELIIETNEAELAHYKERAQHLDECVMKLTEEKETLNRQGSELEQQMGEMTKNVEEKMLVESQLTDKLEKVQSSIELLNKQLEEVTEENRDLSKKHKEQEELVTKLKIKLKKSHEKVTQLKTLQSNVEELEKMNESLKKQIEELEANQRHNQEGHEASQKQNMLELEKIEADYQAQMAELLDAKNSLTMECEKLNENLKELREKEVEITSELNEYKQKMEEIEAEDACQIQKLSDELKSATDNWKVAINQIETLSQQLEGVQKQLILQSAQETVDDVLGKAVESIYQMNSIGIQTEVFEEPKRAPISINPTLAEHFTSLPESVPTFQWPGDVQKRADYIVEEVPVPESVNWSEGAQSSADQQPTASKMGITEDELAAKVSALENMLNNIDKGKDEILRECTGMVNQLTRLVYEKVKKAENDGGEPPLPLDIESQILAPEDIVDSTNNKKLQEIEFAKCDPDMGHQNQPVFEEIIQPKQAYVTYLPVADEPFGENDDGWGWGPEEARLEEEHIQKAESTPIMQSLKAEVAQLNASLQTLQTERDSYLEEVKQLQVKMAKLVKKCKELKVKNDQLMAGQKSTKKAEVSDFFDLDATIQEELKSQITQLEKRLKELGAELEKEKLEKSNVLKRCDVLASANDRMVEMKEIQDSEVLRWKRKYEDVEEKLQKQVWNSDRFTESQKPTSEATESTEDIEELKNTIKELSIDNEELQALLNEQRQLRLDAEKAKAIGKSEQHEETFAILENKLSDKYKELEAVVSEKQQSIHKLNMAIEEKQKFLEELTHKNQLLEILLSELQKNHSDSQAEYKIQMENIISEKDSSINKLKDSLNETNDIKENLTAQLENLSTNLRDLQTKYQELETLNANLQMELDRERQNNSETQILQLQEQIEHQKASFTKQEEDYIKQIEEKQNELHDQMNKHVELQKQLEVQKQNFEEAMAVQHNQKQHQSTIVELQEELSKQQNLNVQLQTELQVQKESLEEAILLQQNQKQHESTILQLQQELSKQQNLNDELKQSYLTKIEDLEKELAFYSQLGASQQTNAALLNEKESELKQLKVVLDDLNNQKMVLEEDLRRAKEKLEENQNQYAVLESQMEEKMANTVQELEFKWQEQVDERGNTVAESWKYHLTMVETEFAEIREKLRTEIDELEAKCNVLVNENNELRKNVDTEIRNEVDRVSAMQQQINERQHTIQELQKENEALRALESQLIEKDNTITSLKLIVDTTQQQFEEKREVVEEIVKILEKNAPWPLPCEKESVITEFQRQLEVASEKDQEITRLNARIVELQLQFNSSQEKEADIFRLQQQVATLQEREVEIDRLRRVESELQKTLFDLETREEQEILSLNAIIEDYKVQADENKQQLIKLKEEKTTTTQTIEDCRKHQDELTIAFEALQSSVLEKDQEILRLKRHVIEMEEMKNDSNKDVEQLHEQINQHKQDLSVVQQALADCQIQLSVVTQEMAEKTNALEVVTQQLESSTKNFEKIEQDLHTLQALLNSKEQDQEAMMQTHFKDLENYYQEALSAREIDIQTIRSQLNEALATIEHYSGQLNKEMNGKSELELVIKELEQKLSEQSTLLDEEQKQLTEMRSIIEDQVVKIEELKKELFQKSNDYDSLIAEMDIEQKAITQQPKSIEHQTSTSFTSQKVQEQIRIQPEDDMSEPVSRAELDIALYMLHQRDVRCEELMVELTQLLEERDTLQLRLSNAIREKEEIRRRLTGGVQELAGSNSSQEPTTPQSKSSAIFLAASGTELAMEPTEIPVNELNLASKLSELKSVGYKKDKTFVDEQEIRRLQQMSIMQQHIQEASKLPPEAAAKLVDASYTLSRDVQSPSKVLLNWLWGRSTPKVNDT